MNNTTNGSFPTSSPSPASRTPRNNTPEGIFVLPDYAKIIFYVVQCVLVVFGLVGNVLVILSVWCNSRMKKSISNLFIANLAIADIFVLAISHTFVLALEIREFQWPFDEFSCRAIFTLSDAFYGVSIWSIVAISFHRYRGIVHTMRSQLSRKKARVFVCATWFFSIAFITLPLWIFMELRPLGRTAICIAGWPNWASKVAYAVTVNLFFYLLPLVLIIYFYLCIRMSLKQSSGFHKRMRRSIPRSGLRDDVQKRIQENAKALRVLTPVVIVFFVTMLPITVFRLLMSFADMSGFPYTIVVFFSCMAAVVANSSANPLIYTIVSPEFRRSFMRFLGMNRPPFAKSWSRRNMWSQNASEYSIAQTNTISKTNKESEHL